MLMRIMLIAAALAAAPGGTPAAAEDPDACLLAEIHRAEPQATVGELRARCAGRDPDRSQAEPPQQPRPDDMGLLQARLNKEFDTMGRDFVITPHQPNYFLLYTYDEQFNAADSVYARDDPKFAGLKNEETKFQVSMKMPIWRNMLDSSTDLYFAYTQTAWWQVYANEGSISSPFRETNYEPEIFLRYFGGPDLPLGGKVVGFDIGFSHESNGRSEPLSRSWNRIMTRVGFDVAEFSFITRLWYRLPEDSEDDDNPNEYRYLGYGDLRATWAPNEHTFSALWRPGTEKSGFELTWSYPFTDVLRFYAQWWYGYGESLIDYDRKVNRIGVGFAMGDWVIGSD